VPDRRGAAMPTADTSVERFPNPHELQHLSEACDRTTDLANELHRLTVEFHERIDVARLW